MRQDLQDRSTIDHRQSAPSRRIRTDESESSTEAQLGGCGEKDHELASGGEDRHEESILHRADPLRSGVCRHRHDQGVLLRRDLQSTHLRSLQIPQIHCRGMQEIVREDVPLPRSLRFSLRFVAGDRIHLLLRIYISRLIAGEFVSSQAPRTVFFTGFSMFMLLIEMSLWVISAFLLSLAPLLTKSYKGCKCICANGVNSSKKTSSDSDSDLDTDLTTSLGIEKSSKMNGLSWWQKKLKRKSSFSISGMHKYRYNELKAATHNFTTSIGQGNASNFYKAKMPNGESLAIKVLATNVRQGKREFQAEVQLLVRLHHRNLVNLVGYCIEKRQYMLVYVYMNNGSLATHLYSGKNEVLNWNVRLNIALDVASCLEYLHHGTVPPIVHRDIKSSNILLDSSMRARVTSFGVSRKETPRLHSYKVKGSFGYVDPEYILTRVYTTKSDVYSFGVLLFELIAGRPPKASLLEYVELAVINTEGNSGWEELVDSRLEDEYDIQELNGMAALACRCIDSSPINRPSMKDIVQELSQIRSFRNNRAMLEEVTISKYTQDIQNPVAEDGGEEVDDTTQVLLRCFSV